MMNQSVEKTRTMGFLVLGLLITVLAVCLLAAKPAHAVTTFTVDNTLDPGDGTCNQNGLGCTLREAINAANAKPNSGGSDLIRFDIRSPGVHTIRPTSELPIITEAATIDGYTQPGSAPNTLAAGTNAKPLIELDGSNLGASGDGLRIQASNTVIKGLVINRFGDAGVQIGSVSGTSAATLEGNFIGTDPTGTVDRGNGGSGIVVEGARAIVGNGFPGARNLVSGNGKDGVFVLNGTSAVVGNLIGTKKDGASALGNADDGVGLSNADGAFVGSDFSGQSNVVAFNGGNGIEVIGSGSSGNSLTPNSIFANAKLGIDLGGDGPTPNDARDADAGPNGLQNKPVLVSAVTSSGKTTVKGKLNGRPNLNFAVRFFSNPSGNEGKVFIGRADVTTNANGSASFTFRPSRVVAPGQTVTATANGAEGTSEISAPRKVVVQ